MGLWDGALSFDLDPNLPASSRLDTVVQLLGFCTLKRSLTRPYGDPFGTADGSSSLLLENGPAMVQVFSDM